MRFLISRLQVRISDIAEFSLVRGLFKCFLVHFLEQLFVVFFVVCRADFLVVFVVFSN